VRRGAATAWMLLGMVLVGCAPGRPEHAIVQDDGQVVRIPRAEVEDGKVHFYSYPAGGTNVDFLVRTDGKGELHVHLDACYSCYQYRRGYVVEDSDLVCIACRLEYPIADEVWDFIGACAPIPIHSTVDSDSVLIERSMLLKATRYF
jgi:uncharacterized membrane protein